MRLRGFESSFVCLFGLGYDVCCLYAFVVLRGVGMIYINWLYEEPNLDNFISCFLNIIHLNLGKIDAFAWVEFWRIY